jgi:MOSC domain-containing protein YiiM
VNLSTAELEAALDHLLAAPKDGGSLVLIAARPNPGERELSTEAKLDLVEGLVGDNWLARGSRHTPDGSAIPEMQITVMNARVAGLLAGSGDGMALPGDQLYVDLDLSIANLPVGTRLGIGDAVLQVTALPHTGCKKFVARFGDDAMRFVNSRKGRALRLRGMNARVVVAGTVRVGDPCHKLGVVTPAAAVPSQMAAGPSQMEAGRAVPADPGELVVAGDLADLTRPAE